MTAMRWLVIGAWLGAWIAWGTTAHAAEPTETIYYEPTRTQCSCFITSDAGPCAPAVETCQCGGRTTERTRMYDPEKKACRVTVKEWDK